MKQGINCHLGQYTVIADDVRLGDNVSIGNHVTIYPNVAIGDGCRIMDGAVIGRLTYPTVSVSRPAPTEYLPLSIGAGSVIGCHVVLYTGVTLKNSVLLADGVSIREGCVLEDQVFLGRYVMLNYHTRIGTRTRVMDLCHITGNAEVGEDCFIGILVSFANDNDVYLRRFGLDSGTQDVRGPSIGHYVLIGQGVSINPAAHIGDGSIIGSASLVTRDIPAWTIAYGVPASPKQPINPDWKAKIMKLAHERSQTLQES
jgi:UDP-3-O-[3-hydroxymyristoyl] glucosamine N-acyltransferase